MQNAFIGRNALARSARLPSRLAFALPPTRSISRNTGIARGLRASQAISTRDEGRSFSRRREDDDGSYSAARGRERVDRSRPDRSTPYEARRGSDRGTPYESRRGSDRGDRVIGRESRGGDRPQNDRERGYARHSSGGDDFGGRNGDFNGRGFDSPGRRRGDRNFDSPGRGRGDRSFDSPGRGRGDRTFESSGRGRGDRNFDSSERRGGDRSFDTTERGRGDRSFDSPRRGGGLGDRGRGGFAGRGERGGRPSEGTSYADRTPERFSHSNKTESSQDYHDYDSGSPRGESASQAIPYTTAASTFLYGLRSVTAALRANRRQFYKIYFRDRDNPQGGLKKVMELAKKRGVEQIPMPLAALDSLVARVARASGDVFQAPIHDGVCLEASLPQQIPVDALGAVNEEDKSFGISISSQSKEDLAINGSPTSLPFVAHGEQKPLLIWLYGAVDMRNVGAIMRTALYFGIDVIMSKTATPTSGFHRTSAGASEHIRMLRVATPETFIEESKKAGWKFYSAVAPDAKLEGGGKPVLLDDLALSPTSTDPCVVVVGNEDLGLPTDFTKLTDSAITIGGLSTAARLAKIDSLNVSTAAALLIERFARKPTIAELESLKIVEKEKLF